VRVLQQSGGVGIIQRRVFGAQNAGQQPDNCVHHHHGSQFSTTDDVIPDAYLVGNQVLADPFVDPLIATAEQYQARVLRELPGYLLRERMSLRRE
jgi:hypothetical protein